MQERAKSLETSPRLFHGSYLLRHYFDVAATMNWDEQKKKLFFHLFSPFLIDLLRTIRDDDVEDIHCDSTQRHIIAVKISFF